MKNAVILFVCAAVVVGSLPTVFAENTDLERKLDSMSQRLEAQDKLIQDMDARLRQAEDPAFKAQLLSYEERLTELRNELRQGAGNDLIPGWLSKDLRFNAKLRFRFESAANDDRAYRGFPFGASAVHGFPVRSVSEDDTPRNRMIYALWLGFEKDWGKDWTAGFELRSTVNGATSNNVTLDGYFSEDPIGISKGFIAYHPECVDGLKVVGGKWTNPFWGSPIVWDSDVNPEGVYGTYEFKQFGENFIPFATLAMMVADEEANGDEILGLGYQVGFTWKLRDALKWKFAFTFYDWDGFENAINRGLDGGEAPEAGDTSADVWPNGMRAGTFYGNTVALRSSDQSVFYDSADFNIVDIYNEIVTQVPIGQDKTIEFAPYLDFVYNSSDTVSSPGKALYFSDFNTTAYKVTHDDFKNAWGAGFRVGNAKKQGDFKFDYRYAYIEPNAVVGRFSDSAFGFANSEGHVLGGTYMLHDNVSLSGTMYFTKPIFDIDHSMNEEPYFNLDVCFTY